MQDARIVLRKTLASISAGAAIAVLLLGLLCVVHPVETDAAGSAACGGAPESKLLEQALSSQETGASETYLQCFPNGDGYFAVSKHLRFLLDNQKCKAILKSQDAGEIRDFLRRSTASSCAAEAFEALKKLEAVPDYKVFSSSMFDGESLAKGSVSDFDECRKTCGSRGGCIGFSYEDDRKFCVLWKTIRGRLPRGDTRSGALQDIPILRPAAPQSSAPSSFEVRQDTDLPDGDFRTLNNVNLDTCKSSCAAISRCVGFTFDTHNNSCVMKERLQVAVPGNGKLSGVKRRGATQSQATRTIPNILNNTDLPNYGNPAADYQITFMPSIDACKTRCEADQRCQAFTYNLSRRACILKNSYERRDRVGGAFSGIKE